MEDQVKNLQTYFQRFKIKEDEVDQFGDELILGECWTWKEPEMVDYWSLVLTPMSGHLSFVTKYKNCSANLPVSLFETVTKIDTGPADLVTISCKTNKPDQKEEYVFSYVVLSTRIIFSIATTCKSYKDTSLSAMATDIARNIEAKRWVSKDNGPLPPKVLVSRLNAVIQEHATVLKTVQTKQKNMRPISISKEYGGRGGSHGNPVVHATDSGVSRTTSRKQGQL